MSNNKFWWLGEEPFLQCGYKQISCDVGMSLGKMWLRFLVERYQKWGDSSFHNDLGSCKLVIRCSPAKLYILKALNFRDNELPKSICICYLAASFTAQKLSLWIRSF